MAAKTKPSCVTTKNGECLSANSPPNSLSEKVKIGDVGSTASHHFAKNAKEWGTLCDGYAKAGQPPAEIWRVLSEREHLPSQRPPAKKPL
jgi:hypothetical protein